MPIAAILFDLDGTLVDSNELHVDAWIEVFHQAGHTEITAEIVRGQIGKGGDNLVPTLLPHLSEDEQEALSKQNGDLFKARYLDQVRPFPHARDLLARAHEDGRKIVLASSAGGEELDHYIDLLDIRELVEATTSKDDVENSKPDPDIFATALQKTGVPADQAMVVGDTPYDIEAAAKCGIRTVALRSGGFSAAALREAGAVALYEDVAAVLADYENSPLAR